MSSGNGFLIQSLMNDMFLNIKKDSETDMALSATGAVISIEPASNCFQAQEPTTGITGSPIPTMTESGKIIGILDMHMHLGAAFAFGGGLRCGKPYALGGFAEAMDGNCKSFGSFGIAPLIENALGGTGSKPLVGGYPAFEDWPTAKTVLHEQAYYKSLERSFKAGVRAIKIPLLANRVLCQAYPVTDISFFFFTNT
jgi:hypothetical protein